MVMANIHPKAWTVLHGGSSNVFSPYATTAATTYAASAAPPRPPASPWMGEPQSRVGYMPSGYQSAYFRDKPASETLDSSSVARASFSRPKTSTLEETQQWKGHKDDKPLKTCLMRGEVKEPRFHAFKMGAINSAHTLIQPDEADPSARFAVPPPTVHKGAIDPSSRVIKPRGPGESGYAIANSAPQVAAMITAPQGQSGARRHPSLTLRQAENVLYDSSSRYFHARDYYEMPFMTSSNYYQTDAMEQLAEMKRRKESLTAQPSTRPQTGFARTMYEAPFAPDVGDGIGAPLPVVGAGIGASWSAMPAEIEVKGRLMPTAFSRTSATTTGEPSVAEPPPAPPLPERFARIRARHDYLRWGGEGSMYTSTARAELPKPSQQKPLGGFRKEPPGGWRTSSTDHSGYHTQISANPIPDWE